VSPAPIVTPKGHARVMREIIQPAIQGMAQDGLPFSGFLYAGLMIDPAGNPKTVEFNCRLGDPETQPILLRLKSDLLELVERALAGKLSQVEADWRSEERRVGKECRWRWARCDLQKKGGGSNGGVVQS